MTTVELIVKYKELLDRTVILLTILALLLLLDAFATYIRSERTKRLLINLGLVVSAVSCSFAFSLLVLRGEYREIKEAVERKSPVTHSEETARVQLEQRALNP